MKLKILNSEVQELLSERRYDYKKYVTQIINLANQNAQGTRARVVGQMSELIQIFEGASLSEWEKWYLEKHPTAIDDASEKIWNMIRVFQESIKFIDRDTVKQWVEELVIVKTFAGLKFQQAILKAVAREYNKEYRLALPEEESKGIDGFIGELSVSIKPSTYKTMLGLNENIDVPIIFYEKRKGDILIEFNLPDLENNSE